MASRRDVHKELAIDTLESIAYWMRKSNFSYSVKDLQEMFDKVISEYLLYKNYKE